MKTIELSITALILATLLCGSSFAQNIKADKTLTVTYTWSRIQSHGSNQVAVWIEDLKGSHIATLFATRFTAKGGYAKRPVSLGEWTAKFDLKNATKDEVDAVSGATPQAGTQTLTWNGNDRSGKPVPAGIYVVRMEANIHDADKMFFRGEIEIGGKNRQTTGEITYSKPELANGNVLFKDVVVEYK